MKKILFTLICFITVGIVKADDYIKLNGYIEGLYPAFCMGNQYVFVEDGENYTIYDDQFNVVKTITAQVKAYEYTYSVIENGEERVWKETSHEGAKDLLTENMICEMESSGILTQNLFNNDALFEYLRLLMEPRTFTKTHSWGSETYTNYPVEVGFEIINEDGDIITSVRFPDDIDGQKFRIEGPRIIILGENYFLIFRWYDGNEDFNLLYPIKKGGNGIGAPLMIKSGAKVAPNNVRRSEMVNVTLEQPIDRACSIKIVSTNGHVAYSATISAGAQSAQINTSRLAPGLYIVNVCDGKTITENCKLIIR